ncbi:MAG: acyl-CoA/acyl-ACP dehydrogenase [Planctomycetes bacterium]|nr:acyl-CoA/acyl-ACP dehydrogenase [Planctomycetota bacterium]
MPFQLSSALEAVTTAARAAAHEVDAQGRFPKEAVDAARRTGLLGLVSAVEVGGAGLGLRQAALAVETIAQDCGSAAMVLTMHWCGATVIEKLGREPVRRAIARGDHLSTLAFSESGSRSHFWAPMGTATLAGDAVELQADKSWITSANHADAYVWSSRPSSASGMSTLWLVPRDAAGLEMGAAYDGFGLRGNDSCAVRARSVRVAMASRLGEDGAGFDAMMRIVLPTFSVLIAAGSIGIMEAALSATVKHCTETHHMHLSTSLADLPTIRETIARMRIRVDATRALWLDSLDAIERARPDAMLRVLEVKAAAADAAIEVVDAAMRAGGGAAYRKEAGLERRFRDARAAAVMAPTSDQLHDFLGKAVCGMPLF